MVLPAYDQCIKASHAFNLLDARGVISVTERQSYILRVRNLAKACGAAFLNEAPPHRLDGANFFILDRYDADLLLELRSEEIPGPHAAQGGGRPAQARHRCACRCGADL
jgi:hypothetical protein